MKLILLLATITACTEEVPKAPSYQQDVMPILSARCVRCHGYPQISATPPDMRLDTFETRGGMNGAHTMASILAGRVSGTATKADGTPKPTMPPRFALTDEEVETLVRWADQGGLRGEPRADNHEPVLSLSVMRDPSDARHFTYDYDLSDVDGDYATAAILVDYATVEDVKLPDKRYPVRMIVQHEDLFADFVVGRGHVEAQLPNLGTLLEGTGFALKLHVDDGAALRVFDYGVVIP